MITDFASAVEADLQGSRALPVDMLMSEAQEQLHQLPSTMETLLGEAGYYERSAAPYEPPRRKAQAPARSRRPTLASVRRLWIGRWNPSDDRWQERGKSYSDIGDRGLFPWDHPEMAVRDGWWISTERWRDPRLHPRLGDLVVVQRQRPVAAQRRAGAPEDVDITYIGLASVLAVASCISATSGRYESRACLAPLVRFTHPVPRTTAQAHGRLSHPDFSKMPATAEGAGLNRQISAVAGEAAVDLLSICGVSPEVLAESDLALLAARLASTETGNRDLLAYRYDHHVRDAARRVNEHKAEAAATAWAASNGFSLVRRDALVPLAGYDLLFTDGCGRQLQVEVKGYSSARLADVHLQPSQVKRSAEAEAGVPPDWRLFALLKASTARPEERVLTPSQVRQLLATGGLQQR